MHHLKTMAEALLYFWGVAPEMSDDAAELVLAEAYHKKAEMLRESGAATSAVAEAERASAAHLKGRRRSRKTARALAEELRMESWYWRVYSVACEPAHLGDLVDFMPSDSGELHIGGAVRRRPPAPRSPPRVLGDLCWHHPRLDHPHEAARNSSDRRLVDDGP
jgi:hypothetical protein